MIQVSNSPIQRNFTPTAKTKEVGNKADLHESKLQKFKNELTSAWHTLEKDVKELTNKVHMSKIPSELYHKVIKGSEKVLTAAKKIFSLLDSMDEKFSKLVEKYGPGVEKVLQVALPLIGKAISMVPQLAAISPIINSLIGSVDKWMSNPDSLASINKALMILHKGLSKAGDMAGDAENKLEHMA